MSETVIHIGKLKKLEISTSIEDWAANLCKTEYNCQKLSNWTTNWIEELMELSRNRFVIVDDNVFEVLEDDCNGNYDDIFEMKQNDDGTFSYILQYHNGGCCYSEAIEEAYNKYLKTKTMSNQQPISEEMDKFLDEIDRICWKYGYEIWPTDKINAMNEDGSYPTMSVHGRNGEIVKIIYIDGDGRGK